MGFETVTRVASRTSVLFDAPGDHHDDQGKVLSDEACSTTSSSSIGRDSDDDVSSERSMNENENENEAESKYNGGALEAMEALEQVLPMRRGISNYYNGKSKSFTSLADVVTTPSVKDIVKPENAYTRRRRNLMALTHVWDKNRNSSLRSNGGGISKRTMSLSKSSLALAVAMTNSDSNSSISSDDSPSSSSNSSSPSSTLPPLPPRNRVSSLASPLQRNFFSLADLHHCAIAASMKMSSSSLGHETAHHQS
ncbi:hypothetical protein TSUD_06870 [Trifolium subterraneum]|uniref:Uncharacterized protein n=1 Tax=Trifolium subterraneum TaxID=3900 RepID=A0A2Z6P0F9_TRISU|nr:hypothetical protein TSUD_06870 [Trifolium subterraneum]